MSVGLCMIVKDEAHVIERCLRSVSGVIDTWTIVDTGSTDGTQQVVKDVMCDLGVEGMLHQREWVDFGHNRMEALALARGVADWSLMIDADEVLTGTLPIEEAEDLGAACIRLRHRVGDGTFRLEKVFSNAVPWWYEGVLHEYPATAAHDPVVLDADGPEVIGYFDSARNRLPQQMKYAADAETLLRALRTAPPHLRNRYTYYLARSYRDAKMPVHALRAFRERVALGGWIEEVADSLLHIAVLLETIGDDPETAYRLAVAAAPERAEPLTEYARWLRLRGRYGEALRHARSASEMGRPDAMLFVDETVYEWRALDEVGLAWFGLAEWTAALQTWEAVLERAPEREQERVRKNIALVRERMGLTDVEVAR